MHPHISRYHYNVEPFTEDALGNLSWGRLGNLILRCASLHAGEHGFGFDDMVKQGRVWVLSRLVIEMDEMPRTNDDLYIETWVGRAYRRFTDRHFSVMRADGTAYGHATSVWALIDLQTRQSADLEALPDGGLQPFVVADRPLPIAPPSRLPRLADSRPVAIHKAAFTDLDINGHVNSIRLLEMILDRFTLEELIASKWPTRPKDTPAMSSASTWSPRWMACGSSRYARGRPPPWSRAASGSPHPPTQM